MRPKAPIGMKRWVTAVMMGVALPLLLNSCAVMEGEPSNAGAAMPFNMPVGEGLREQKPSVHGDNSLAASPDYFRKPTPRPGYATTWGPSINSHMTYTSFRRESEKPHGGVAAIWYNDREGIDAMTNKNYYTSSGRKRAANGLVEWGMRSGFGVMRNYHSGGKRFVVGRKGARYSVSVKNNSRSRLELVVSVDGLDVVDGKPASVNKRGYIVAPGQTLEIKGWRSSEAEVASFVFAPVESSYASLKHGNTRNIGVVGLAVFTEKGVDPWSGRPADAHNRFAASPFAEAPMSRAR